MDWYILIKLLIYIYKKKSINNSMAINDFTVTNLNSSVGRQAKSVHNATVNLCNCSFLSYHLKFILIFKRYTQIYNIGFICKKFVCILLNFL